MMMMMIIELVLPPLSLWLCLFRREKKKNSWGISRNVQQGPCVFFFRFFSYRASPFSLKIGWLTWWMTFSSSGNALLCFDCLLFCLTTSRGYLLCSLLLFLGLLWLFFIILSIFFVAWYMLSFWWIGKRNLRSLSVTTSFEIGSLTSK